MTAGKRSGNFYGLGTYLGLAGAVLESKPTLYLGRISYGIYVYHLLVPAVFRPVLSVLGVTLAPKGIAEFMVFTSLTIATASLSWTFLERPINQLKQRFAPASAPAALPTPK